MAVRAVIFDVDGLMMDSERVSRRSWELAIGPLGYILPDSLYLQMVGRTIRDVEGLFRQEFGPDFPFETIYPRRMELLSELMKAGIPLKPGMVNLLDYLDGTSLKRAVGTSSERGLAMRKLENGNLRARFEVIVTSEDAPRGKPFPDLFLEAARRLDVAPADCMVLEDSEPGIRAAYAAGMLPVMVPDMKQPDEEVKQMAYRVLLSLQDVIPLLNGGTAA